MGKQISGSLFALEDFRPFVRAWVEAKGRGEYRKIGLFLNMHSTLVSQIFSGRKCLTEEQASKLCEFMGLSQLETDYFLKLVQRERAGNENLRRIFNRHLALLKRQSEEAKSRVPDSKELSEEDRAIFYSSWQHSIIRLLTSMDEFQTPASISSYLRLPPSRVRDILGFLCSRALVIEGKDGKFKRTEKNTHIEAGSPLVVRHHQNWRAKAQDLIEKMSPDDLAFTAPVSISTQDALKVRSILLDTISEVAKIVEKSPSEEVIYFGIDWLKC